MTYYLHKNRVLTIKLNLFNLKLDLYESEGANKGRQKIRRENRLSEKDRQEKTRMHIYILSTQKTGSMSVEPTWKSRSLGGTCFPSTP